MKRVDVSLDFETGIVVRVKPRSGISLADKYVKRFRCDLQAMTLFRLTTVVRLRHVFASEREWTAFREQFTASADRFMPETHSPLCDWRPEDGESSATCTLPAKCQYLGMHLCARHSRPTRAMIHEKQDVAIIKRLGARASGGVRAL